MPIHKQVLSLTLLSALSLQAIPSVSIAAPLQTGSRSGLVGSNLVADVAEQIAPSVVTITIEKEVKRPKLPKQFDNGFFNFGGFRFQLPDGSSPGLTPNNGSPLFRQSSGSGIILDTDGHILTNHHVVKGVQRVNINLHDGTKLSAKVVGSDEFSDLALLQLEAMPNTPLTPAPFGNSGTLRPGEWVLAVGNPLGFAHTVTIGIVSGLSRELPDINDQVSFIQTDAAINPGNSGGPLVNLKGQVIGINTAINARGQNLGFAIPINDVKRITAKLKKEGTIKRPFLGVGLSNTNPRLLKSLGLNTKTQGVVISQVRPDSPADQAGLVPGDIIQRIDGKGVNDAKVVQTIVKNWSGGSPLMLQVLRDGRLLALEVTPAQVQNTKAFLRSSN